MTKQSCLSALLGGALLCASVASVAVSRAAADEAKAPPASAGADAEKKPNPFPSVETKDLHNAYRVTDKLISGAAPESEQAFRDLAALGVRTIISVDGAKPDVAAARRHGMRYVHLPIGYDGVEPAEGRSLAKALKELEGPIYLHCHHGKHRSAAAVAVACVTNGSIEPDRAESVLETFGTGKNYKGLWRAAREAKPFDARALDEVKVEYVEQAQIPELAERMVELDKTWDRLKAVRAAGWRAPSDHPDLDPAHEALQLQEHLRETARADDLSARPAGYRRMLGESESGAASLREALAARAIDPRAAESAFTGISNSCVACHKAYRD